MTILQGPKHLPSNADITSLVVLLHGYGADGNDLIGLAPVFASHLPHTAFHSPDGPEMCELSAFGRQWFSLARCDSDFLRRNPPTQDIAFEAMYQGACEAAIKVEDYVHTLMEHYKLTANQVVLLGFSQGTMMALHIGLRHKEQFAGIVGFSGALVGASHLKAEIKSQPPVLLIHGEADEMLPIHALDLAKSALEDAGVSPQTLRCADLPHSIDQEGAMAAIAFIRSVL
jgi:phospholipase/carboxylesterase